MNNTFQVLRIRNLDFGEKSIVRASIDLQDPAGVIIYDCFLKEGQFGWFLEGPQKKLDKPYTNPETGKVKNYLGHVGFPKHLRDEINRVCVEAYDPAGNYVTPNTTATTTTETVTNGEHPLATQTEEMFSTTEDGGLPQ